MSDKILIFGREDDDVSVNENGSTERSWFFKRSEDIQYGTNAVDVDKLQERLTTFLHSMNRIVDSMPVTLGDFRIDSLELSVEVGAKGSVSLLGSGGEVSGSGGIRFVLKRKLVTEEP